MTFIIVLLQKGEQRYSRSGGRGKQKCHELARGDHHHRSDRRVGHSALKALPEKDQLSTKPRTVNTSVPELFNRSQHNTVSVSRQFVVCGHLLLHDALHGGPARDHVHGVRQPAAGLRRAAAQEEEGQLQPHPRHQAGD